VLYNVLPLGMGIGQLKLVVKAWQLQKHRVVNLECATAVGSQRKVPSGMKLRPEVIFWHV